jgi:hypothetical protein
MNPGPSADAVPLWVGLAVASTALLGVALGLPTGAPDATDPARTVDEVASSPHDATATATFSRSSRVVLRPTGLERCRGDACSHATFAFGPVTPVAEGSALAAVLAGRSPRTAFATPVAFRRAAAAARARAPVVRETARLRARHVTWRGVDVTLVG